MPTINLNSCQKGQKLKLNNGEFATYIGREKKCTGLFEVYPHKAKFNKSFTISHWRDDGVSFHDTSWMWKDQLNVVEILPVESKVKKIKTFEIDSDFRISTSLTVTSRNLWKKIRAIIGEHYWNDQEDIVCIPMADLEDEEREKIVSFLPYAVNANYIIVNERGEITCD